MDTQKKNTKTDFVFYNKQITNFIKILNLKNNFLN